MRTIGLIAEAEAADAKAKEPSKAELAAKAAELGIDVPSGATKAQIAELIAEAEAADAD